MCHFEFPEQGRRCRCGILMVTRNFEHAILTTVENDSVKFHSPTYLVQYRSVDPEALSWHVDAAGDRTAFIIGAANVDNQRAAIMKISSESQDSEEHIRLYDRRGAARSRQGCVPRWRFLRHVAERIAGQDVHR